MRRKIRMIGQKAQYIERRGAYATPDNDREIIMEGDEAVYQEYAYGHTGAEPRNAPSEKTADDYKKEAARKLLMDNAEYVEPVITNSEKVKINSEKEAGEIPSSDVNTFELDAKAIEKCFKFNNDFVKRSVGTLVTEFYQGNNANLALIEITLFHHQQLKRRNSHKPFVMALAAWGIITITNADELKLIVMGVSDKYKRMPKEGYQKWDDNNKTDRLACERMGEKLGPSMKYME